jgi:hypothetical protein
MVAGVIRTVVLDPVGGASPADRQRQPEAADRQKPFAAVTACRVVAGTGFQPSVRIALQNIAS